MLVVTSVIPFYLPLRCIRCHPVIALRLSATVDTSGTVDLGSNMYGPIPKTCCLVLLPTGLGKGGDEKSSRVWGGKKKKKKLFVVLWIELVC